MTGKLETARAVFKAIASKDSAALEDLFAPGLQYEILPKSVGHPVRDKERTIKRFQHIDEVVKDGAIHFEELESFEAGDKLVLHVKTVNTVSPDGKHPYTNEYIMIFTFDGDKVSHVKEFMDSAFAAKFAESLAASKA